MVGVEDLHFRDLRHAGVSWLFEMDWDIPAALHPSAEREADLAQKLHCTPRSPTTACSNQSQASEKEVKQMDVRCTSLDEVRQRIDEIDRSLVSLLAKRGRLVTQAASFKKTTDDVRAPARVEQVIKKVREMADETGASAEVVEQVYRAMISAFIAEELNTHAKLAVKASAS